jgi:glycosyltransferase involved in cell wall biosynthesis
MKKFLIVAHYSRFLVQFELNDVRLLQSMGFEVHYATNYQQEDMFSGAIKIIQENGVILHQVDFVRSPYSIPANIKAYRQLKDLMVKEKFSGVHCHTPMAGALARLAANATHTVPVIYTAHGFHFYKGCPLKNKLIYQTAETFLARYTDAQITINQEDFAAAQKFPLRGKAYYVPGIGVDVKKISSVQVDRATKRAELGIPQDAFVFISVGELNENKNHATVVRALAKADIPNSYYLICGEGKLKQQHFELAQKLGISEKVKLLGFRTDVSEILRACDCFVFPSSREGLSVSLMEAMAAGLPCIASRIRGNVDLLENSRYLFEPADENALCQLLKDAANGVQIEQECELNWETLKKYDIKNVSKEMQSIYSAVIEGTTTNESFTSIKK